MPRSGCSDHPATGAEGSWDALRARSGGVILSRHEVGTGDLRCGNEEWRLETKTPSHSVFNKSHGKAPEMINRPILEAVFAALILVFCPLVCSIETPQKPAPARRPRLQQSKPTVPPLLERAQAAMDAREFARAAEALEQFLATQPDHLSARFNLAYCYAELKRYSDARKNYEDVLKIDPGLYQANLNLGLILVEEKDFIAAVVPLEKVVASKPNEARGHSLLAFALEKSGKLAEAAKHYRAASQADPQNIDFHLALGRVEYELKNFAQADSEFRAAQSLQENSPQACLGLAETLLAQNQSDRAALLFESYLVLKPDDGDTRQRLAGLYLDLNRPEKALSTLLAGSPEKQASLPWKEMAARAYAMLQRWPQAIRLYHDLALARPGDAATLAALGDALLKNRQFEAAAGALERALRLRPSPPSASEARRNLVSAYYLAANYPAALAALDSLAAVEPLPPILVFVRATCYDHLRQTKAAVENYRKFLELAGGNLPDQEFQARHRLITLERELKRR